MDSTRLDKEEEEEEENTFNMSELIKMPAIDQLLEQMSYREKPELAKVFANVLSEFGQVTPLLELLSRGNTTMYTVFHDGRSGESILDKLYSTRRATMSGDERAAESSERATLMDTRSLWYFLERIEDDKEEAAATLNSEIDGYNSYKKDGEAPSRSLQMRIKAAQLSGLDVNALNT